MSSALPAFANCPLGPHMHFLHNLHTPSVSMHFDRNQESALLFNGLLCTRYTGKKIRTCRQAGSTGIHNPGGQQILFLHTHLRKRLAGPRDRVADDFFFPVTYCERSTRRSNSRRGTTAAQTMPISFHHVDELSSPPTNLICIDKKSVSDMSIDPPVCSQTCVASSKSSCVPLFGICSLNR